jgi:hypothetical protein
LQFSFRAILLKGPETFLPYNPRKDLHQLQKRRMDEGRFWGFVDMACCSDILVLKTVQSLASRRLTHGKARFGNEASCGPFIVGGRWNPPVAFINRSNAQAVFAAV